jgi:putative serine protease PepD
MEVDKPERLKGNPMKKLVATFIGAACIGAGGGAGVYAALSPASTTVVRQVTVPSGQATASTSALSVGDVYNRTHKGVVEITVTTTGNTSAPPGFGGPQTQQAQGSGFVYDSKGDIVTNEHVVDGATSISVKFWDGTTKKATVVGTDASDDLAVIHVDAPSSLLFPLTLGDSSKLAVGDGAVAIGSPFGLEETVTSGIVSALHRQMTSPNNFTIDDSIQTDAAINHGNSGGPLLNTQAQVIGVTAQIESDSGGNDGVGFAIPSNTVKSVVTQLIAGGTVQHAYLGVGISSSGTAKLTNVVSGAPADKAGLQVGDVITAIDGTKISTGDELRAAIAAKSPGDTVSVTYTRGGTSHTASVKLADRPS